MRLYLLLHVLQFRSLCNIWRRPQQKQKQKICIKLLYLTVKNTHYGFLLATVGGANIPSLYSIMSSCHALISSYLVTGSFQFFLIVENLNNEGKNVSLFNQSVIEMDRSYLTFVCLSDRMADKSAER